MASAWAIAAPIASPISSLKYGKCQFSGDSTTPSSDTISDAITFLIGASSDLVGCVLCTWWHGEGLGTSCESTVFACPFVWLLAFAPDGLQKGSTLGARAIWWIRVPSHSRESKTVRSRRGLFTGVRGIEILRSSSNRSSRKFTSGIVHSPSPTLSGFLMYRTGRRRYPYIRSLTIHSRSMMVPRRGRLSGPGLYRAPAL